MTERNVPVQSLIDHIKTAIDVDPWAKEMVEYLLKEQEPIEPVDDGHGSLICGNQGYECGCVGRYDLTTKVVEKYCNFCPECGRKVKWE